MPPQREFWRDVDLDPAPRTCTKKSAPPYRRRSVPARAPPHPPTTRTTGTHARARIGAVDPTDDASVVDAAAPRYARDAARVWTADESSTTRRARWFTATPRRASPPPPAGSSGIWTSARGPRRAPRPPRTSSTDPRRESSTTSRRRPYLTTRRSALSGRSSPNTAPRTRARRRTRGTLTRSASSSRVRSISTWRSCRLTRPRSTAR